MQHKIVEATNGFNWGKFLVCRFDEADFTYTSLVSQSLLLTERGWARDQIWVLDLETREGAAFQPGGSPNADLKSIRSGSVRCMNRSWSGYIARTWKS